MVTAPLFSPFFVARLESRLSQNSSAKDCPGLAECHAVRHDKAVATVRSYFQSVCPIFKRSKRHMTICSPSETKTPVLALLTAQLHCLRRWPRYSNIGQYCVNRTCMALQTAYQRLVQRFAGPASPRGVTFPVEALYVGSHTQQQCTYGYLHPDQLEKTGNSLTAA